MVECNVIEKQKVLMDLPHVSDMRNDWKSKLLCQQTDSEELADAREPRAVCLYEMYRTAIKEILEQNSIRDVLPGGKPYRRNMVCELRMRVRVIGMRWFLDPQRRKRGQRGAHALCVWQVPTLICVEHHHGCVSGSLPQHASPSQVARFFS